MRKVLFLLVIVGIFFTGCCTYTPLEGRYRLVDDWEWVKVEQEPEKKVEKKS